MSGQKFFHGLTEAMINRGAERPDRQKSNFYWPEEYLEDPQDRYVTSSRRQSTASSSATTTPKECPSPASEIEAGEFLKQRQRSNIRSHIEFSDENDSAFSQLARERQREKLRIEQFLREQSDDVSEAAKTKRQNTLKSKIQFYDYVETPNGRSSPRKHATNGYHTPTTPDHEDIPLSRFSPQSNGANGNYRRQLSSPASSEYHYSARYTGSYDDFEEDDARSYRSSNELNFSPPGTPLSNGAGDIPEHKRQSHRHLRSSIAFCNGVVMADEGEDTPGKAVSVRDSAAQQRVGVGLPNL